MITPAPKNRYRIFPLLLLFVLASSALRAQDVPEEPVGHVNDFANLLQPAQVQQLETKLRNFRDTTSNIIGIVTLPSLHGNPIEDVSIKMANKWKMWEGKRFNGVLIVVAPKERQMRIEVGYGLEGALPDILAGRIINNIMKPSFRKGDFYGGLDKATTTIMQLVQGEYKGSLTEKKDSGKSSRTRILLFLAFIAFVFFITRRGGKGNDGGRGRGRRRSTLHSGGIIVGGFGGGFGGGSGGGGGGFGGFSGGGGFGFGGGGASGGW